ncbi:MAG TPA: respiratory nitrate reductase subunit gamma [Bacteroidia bacterium]|jgi:nitrate reductase gamma subunit|nr:respiratory nitrate reductase subunit gamma [Bacteroidia bacterium]
MDTLNNFLFIGLPYAALATFLIGTIFRYSKYGYKVSSLSSEFLEGRRLFWGSQPFHWGILVVFLGHLIAFLFPRSIILWNGHPVRLLILEITGFIFGISALIGLINLFVRRLTEPRLKVVTNKMDILIELLLLVQIFFGLWVAYSYRWGSSWFASVMTPYLWSIFSLSPDIQAVLALPWVVKIHIIGAFLIIGIFPFTRLVHFLVAPLHYIGRPYQLVIWYRDRRTLRSPNSPWVVKYPKNN